MSTETLSASISTGIVLTAAGSYTSPFTVTSTGIINTGTSNAIESNLSFASLANFGDIAGEIYFAKNGQVTNFGSSAIISQKILMREGGTVDNSATISGETQIDGLGTVINSGSMNGALIYGGGYVGNSGVLLGVSGFNGLTVENSGKITGSVYEVSGGTVINKPGGYIYGWEHGIYFNNDTGIGCTVINYGTIVSYRPSAFVVGDPGGIGFWPGERIGIGSSLIENLGTASTISNINLGYQFTDGTLSVENQGSIGGIDIPGYGTIKNDFSSSYIEGISTSFRRDYVTNYGIIGAVALSGGGSVYNGDSGAILKGVNLTENTLSDNVETVDNNGEISGQFYGVVLSTGGGTVINSGTISGAFGAIALNGTAGSKLVVEQGASFNGGIYSTNTLNTLELAAGHGVFGTLGLDANGFQSVTFDPGAAWTLAGNTTGLTNTTISGFAAGNTLALDGFTATSDTFVSGAGLELGNGSSEVTLDLVGSFSTEQFQITGTTLGTDITICYLPGTRILTQKGEKLVEELQRGDMVLTRFSGFQLVKWMGRQSYAPRFLAADRLPIRIAPGALGENSPAEALRVSPGHSMLVNGVLVLAKHLVNGITITQPDVTETVEYYAIELDAHDCVLANHTWGESFADGPGLRSQFHNVAEFHVLFPDYVEPDSLALCAPRPEEGSELEAALRPVLARARTEPGRLHGYVDICGPDKIEGWAWDEATPHLPVELAIYARGQHIGNALACHYRGDLATAGYGRGYCQFTFTLPEEAIGPFLVQRASDGQIIVPTQACAAAAR